jgi:nucleoside-diphosphate kinase
MEQTLVLIKPDGVQRGLIGEIVTRLERRGLKLCGMKFMQMTRELASAHYKAHEGKPFYNGLVEYITSGPIVAMIWEGKDAIQIVRTTMGATNAGAAAPGTIRGDFAVEIGRNLVHGSDGAESAAYEGSLFFAPEELVTWNRATDIWIRE